MPFPIDLTENRNCAVKTHLFNNLSAIQAGAKAEAEAINGAGIRLTFSELSIMTDEFSEANTIVKSDEFNLFRGKIGTQEEFTVKIWHSSYKLERLMEEVTILGHPRMLNFPNIVKLIGYCREDDHVGAVYKLNSVDTVENLLDKDEFQWRDRMVAALGIARIFQFFGVQGISHLIHTTLLRYIILDQGSNPVLCDVRVMSGGVMLLNEGGEDSFAGNDGCLLGEDVTAGKMKPNGIFALGLLLLQIMCEKRQIYEDAKTKLPYSGYPTIATMLSVSPLKSQLEIHSFFYKCDRSSVTSLADQCLEYGKKCPTINEVVQKLENLLLFSLPVRTSSGEVAVGGHTLVYFTYSDLCRFTDNFSKENLFAITQFGEAYRGRIQQGWEKMCAGDIIVKMWGQLNFRFWDRVGRKSSVEDNICRLRDEVFLLSQRWMIDNPTIVKLLGYCFEGNKVGAVYSVQPLYTLESLFDDECFEWKDRIVVALELARTLALLHGKEQQHLLCNLSGAHIMIDEDKKPILYDFSMLHGQVLSGRRAARRSHLISSIDYLDPYLLQTGLVVPQSDIYAFGALLLSLLCKRDVAIAIRTFNYEHIEAKYKSKSSHAHESFASQQCFDHHDAQKLSALAMDCLGQDFLLSRPTASDIVEQLQSLSVFADTPVPTLDKVKVIDSYTDVERKPSRWKPLRLFGKLSITSDKRKGRQPFLGKTAPSGQMSPRQIEIMKGPIIVRSIVHEKTPEQLRSAIEEIDSSLKQEMEVFERQRVSQMNLVKSWQSNFIKQSVV